jgi:hypothetical protein
MIKSSPIVVAIVVAVSLIVAVLPTVHSSGCPAFNISDSVSRDKYLSKKDKFFPAALKEIVNKYEDNNTIFTGIYDCHTEDEGNEIGMAAICEPGSGNCTCVAQYNFNVCNSCELECGTSGTDINIESYTADCSNVMGGLTNECTVECGFVTSGCLASDLSSTSAAVATTIHRCHRVVGAMFLVVAATTGLWMV